MACIEKPKVKLNGIIGLEKGALVSDVGKGGCMCLAKTIAGKVCYHGKDFLCCILAVALSYGSLDKGGPDPFHLGGRAISGHGPPQLVSFGHGKSGYAVGNL